MIPKKTPTTYQSERAEDIADLMLPQIIVILAKLQKLIQKETPENAPPIVEMAIGALGSTIYQTMYDLTREGETASDKAIHAALKELKQKKRKPVMPHHIQSN